MQTQFKIFFLKKKLFFFQIIIINNNDRHLHSHQHRFPLALTLPVFYKTQSDFDVFIKINENKLILN